MSKRKNFIDKETGEEICAFCGVPKQDCVMLIRSEFDLRILICSECVEGCVNGALVYMNDKLQDQMQRERLKKKAKK